MFRLALRFIYAIFGALSFAAATAALALSELYLIEQTPLVHLLARDVEYGLETYRTLSQILPWLAAVNAIVGACLGWLIRGIVPR